MEGIEVNKQVEKPLKTVTITGIGHRLKIDDFHKVFTASDGRCFETEKEREEYERELKEAYFYLVRFSPDLEGSGKSTKKACVQVLGAKDLREAELYLRYHLFEVFGNELTKGVNTQLVFSWSYEWVDSSTYLDMLCDEFLQLKTYTGTIRGLQIVKPFTT